MIGVEESGLDSLANLLLDLTSVIVEPGPARARCCPALHQNTGIDY